MRHPSLFAGLAALAITAPLAAQGFLVPTDRSLPAAAVVYHRVNVTVRDQVATTEVDQAFRNPTRRPIEATFLFPVPKGANVDGFSMWVNGQEQRGELLKADRARQIYTDIVRRYRDPGLLEYLGRDLIKLRVFPVPPGGDQRIKVKYTSLAKQDNALVEYVYPMRSLKKDGNVARRTLRDFTFKADIKSRAPIQAVYSPSHRVDVVRESDGHVIVGFEQNRASLNKDLQIFYGVGGQEVGLTALTHRPDSAKPGYALLMISPRVEAANNTKVARDVVLVCDTSGSMNGVKMSQARRALKKCLADLSPGDRFGLVRFSTGVTKFADSLTRATPENLKSADAWVTDLKATGGTAIASALQEALSLREDGQGGRPFTVIFFTDGLPTIGERDPKRILAEFNRRAAGNVRVFTFGVGDDVNATLLDQVADRTRAVSTYVRPTEDIATKAASLSAKIRNPVLTGLELSVNGDTKLEDVYPQKLPDLFSGGQLIVLARYTGDGAAALKLTGSVGEQERRFVYDVKFVGQSGDEREFVEGLWARRKVGFLLDAIRANGANKELTDEVVRLATKHGIVTPYTSYLMVPDDVANARPRRESGRFGGVGGGTRLPPGGGGIGGGGSGGSGKKPKTIRGRSGASTPLPPKQAGGLRPGMPGPDTGKAGVNLSRLTRKLRGEKLSRESATRRVNGRGVKLDMGRWVDQGYKPKTKTVTVRAQSAAYFKLLTARPSLAPVFALGNRIVWVTPSGTALEIDPARGKESLTDAEVKALFPS